MKILDSHVRGPYDDHLVILLSTHRDTPKRMEKTVYVRPTFTKLPVDKKERILDVAIDEFSRCGYEKASINRMVGRLGIAKGSIFQYFGSKKNLYFHIFEHAVALVKRSLKGVKAGTEGEDFFIRLATSLQAGIYFIRRYPRIYQIYLKMLFQEDFPFRADLLKTIRLFSIDYLRPIIEEAVTAGQLREDIDPELAAFFLDAVLDRFLQAYCVAYMDSGLGLYQADEKVIEERIQDCIEMVRLGMAAESGQGDTETGRRGDSEINNIAASPSHRLTASSDLREE